MTETKKTPYNYCYSVTREHAPDVLEWRKLVKNYSERIVQLIVDDLARIKAGEK